MISSIAEQTDLAPTILDYLGITAPLGMESRSLLPALEKRHGKDHPVFSINLDGNPVHAPIMKGTVTVIAGQYEYQYEIPAGWGKSYDLQPDPVKGHDLSLKAPARVQAMRTLVRREIRQRPSR